MRILLSSDKIICIETRNTAMFNFAYFIDGNRAGTVKAENKAQALELARKDAERKGLDASKVSLDRN
ncbi:hypothetical protein ACP46_gp01 [Rhizobium phage RHEph06]|uniref:Uncharacterized protein n=1 Tax=Rhizobium phage RHEph06 TaxID=1220714 RepID=L7TJX5_9CAUD|nr:hypothetical protein ACP46_gp01 [Rhizobium phage RHEph06]AGC35843.1 hypothetical protein RHEph06_gp001 [Rhizobium phage RHEph06]